MKKTGNNASKNYNGILVNYGLIIRVRKVTPCFAGYSVEYYKYQFTQSNKSKLSTSTNRPCFALQNLRDNPYILPIFLHSFQFGFKPTCWVVNVEPQENRCSDISKLIEIICLLQYHLSFILTEQNLNIVLWIPSTILAYIEMHCRYKWAILDICV